MPLQRYYSNQPLHANGIIRIEDKEFHHLAHVMRAKKGDRVEIINGQGTLAQGSVTHLAKTCAEIKLESLAHFPKSNVNVILACALPKLNKLDWIVEKGTELGVSEFWLFPGETSVIKSVVDSQLIRLQALIIAATKQCGRLFIPRLVLKPKIEDWTPFTESVLLFGDVSPQAPYLTNLYPDLSESVIFVTGPESGISQHEEAYLKKLNGRGVKLNDNILRTETAAMCAAVLLTHHRQIT